MKNIKRAVFTLCVAIICILSFRTTASAAEANVKISSATVTENETVTVTLTVTSEEQIMGYMIFITYDTSVLSYDSCSDIGAEGTDGKLKIVNDSGKLLNSITSNITFKAKKAGTSKISYVKEDSEIYNVEVKDKMEATANTGIVTVNGPVTASDNNNLKSLTLSSIDIDGKSVAQSLTPAFSTDVTEYRLSVPGNIERLVLKAVSEDTNATVSVSGTKLAIGDNKTTITVKAENGTTKKYIIYTTRADDGSDKTTEPETTTAEPELDDIKVTIAGADYYIARKWTQVTLPEGFEQITFTYKGEEIAAGKGLSKNLILVYLMDANKSGIGLFEYDEVSDTFFRMVNIQTANKLYTLIPFDSDVTIPDGYSITKLNIDGTEVDSYIYGEASDYYLVYAMNWDGQKNLYSYDSVEKTMQRISKNTNGLSGVTPKSDSELQKELDKLQKKYDNNNKIKLIIIVMLSIVCIVLVIIVASMIAKLKGNGNDNNPNEPDDGADDSDEISVTNDQVTNINEENNISEEKAGISEEKGIEEENNKSPYQPEFSIEELGNLIDQGIGDEDDFEFLDINDDDEE